MPAQQRLAALAEHVAPPPRAPAAEGAAAGGLRVLEQAAAGVVAGDGRAADAPADSGGVTEFTIGTGALTPAEREQYARDGYVIVRGLLSAGECDGLYARYEEICRDFDAAKRAGNQMMSLVRDRATVRRQKETGRKLERGSHDVIKLNNYEGDRALMDGFAKHPAVLRYVAEFTGATAETVQTMVVSKPPELGSSTRHPLHQDIFYFPRRPSHRIVAAWCALGTVDRESGCLVALPGSHLQGARVHAYPPFEVNPGYLGIQSMADAELAQRVHLEMRTGDVVFFHPCLVHGSGVNRSADFRKAISCHYASRKECPYIDTDALPKGTSLAHTVLNRDGDKDNEFEASMLARVVKEGGPIADAMKRKGGFSRLFNMGWKVRARKVM